MKIILALFLICTVAIAQFFPFPGPGRASTGGCTASYANEVLTTQNATSPAGITEADATTGWTDSNSGLASSSSAPHLGTYHLTATADANLDGFNRVVTGLTDNQLYRLSLWARHNGTGTDWRCGIGPSNLGYNIKLLNIPVSMTSYTNLTALFRYNFEEDTIQCHENNASNDGGVYLDNVSITEATPCLGSDLHTTANAASLTGEANATTGLSVMNSLNSITSDATAADGSYAIKADASVSPTADNGFYVDLGAAPFSLQDGVKYLVLFKARHIGSGDTWRCGQGSNATSAILSTTTPHISLIVGYTAYKGYGWEFTYSSSLRYFKCNESGSSNNGGIYLDSFVVQRVVSE